MEQASAIPEVDQAAIECLSGVLALARAQAVALESDALTHFDELLEERGALIARLEALASPTPGAAAAEALEALAREIVEQDRRNHGILGDRLRLVRTELPILAAGSRATSAYRTAPNGAPAYVDRAS